MLNLQETSQPFLGMTHFHMVLKVSAVFQRQEKELCINMPVNKVLNYFDPRACRVLCCCNAVESQKAFLKRSIYLLFKIFFTPGFLSRTLKSGAEMCFFTSPNSQTCECMRAGGRLTSAALTSVCRLQQRHI